MTVEGATYRRPRACRVEMQQEPSTESCRNYIQYMPNSIFPYIYMTIEKRNVFYFDCGSEMAERPTTTPAMLSQETPLVKIGHYVLGETLIRRRAGGLMKSRPLTAQGMKQI